MSKKRLQNDEGQIGSTPGRYTGRPVRQKTEYQPRCLPLRLQMLCKNDSWSSEMSLRYRARERESEAYLLPQNRPPNHLHRHLSS